MRYLSVCSGIEAATVAWHPLGWTPVGFSEIEPFPSSVLAHHYPGTPNFGDMTKHEAWPLGPGSIDLLVGGTPCQSFSVAGLRKGLADPRGNLMLTYLAIVDRLRPRWIVWENVPGVLSSNGGRDFGTFLGALGEWGYGWAYRVVDAQWCRSNGHPRAVPQRRRRVFVVGCFGDSRSAAAVLFERESVRRDPAKSRAPGQSTTAGTGSRVARMRGIGDYAESAIGSTLKACDHKEPKDLVLEPDKSTAPIVIYRAAFNQGENALYEAEIGPADTMPSLVARGPHAIAHALTKRHDSSEDGTGRGVPLVVAQTRAVAYPINGMTLNKELRDKQMTGIGDSGDPMFSIRATGTQHAVATYSTPAIGVLREDEVSSTLTRNSGAGGETQNAAFVVQKAQSVAFTQNQREEIRVLNGVAGALAAEQGTHQTTYIASTLVGGGNNRQAPAYAVQLAGDRSDPTVSTSEVAFCLPANPMSDRAQAVAHAQAVPFRDPSPTLTAKMQGASGWAPYNEDAHLVGVPHAVATTLDASYYKGQGMRAGQERTFVASTTPAYAVRRLTPRECERLQGFPDDYTAVLHKGKPAADGPRYKALGNSMAVNCMEWIGERIDALEKG